MSWQQIISQMPLAHFWAFSGCALVAAGGSLWKGFRNIRHARMIEDVPTAKIRSAHQGYVELTGTARAMAGEPIVSPLSGTRCCWYSYKVERRNDKSWSTVEHGESEGLFLLLDDTGQCVVDPEDADITTLHRDSWYGSRTPPPGKGPLAASYRPPGLLRRLSLRTGLHIQVDSGFSGNHRYTEAVILSDDPLYTVGHFKSFDDIDHARHRDELARELLREWKRDKQKMASFDRNDDGHIDTEEWELARREAKREAGRQYREQMAGQHLHTLSRPLVNGQPFLISNLPQFDLARRYRTGGWLALGIFLLSGALAVSMLSSRFLA